MNLGLWQWFRGELDLNKIIKLDNRNRYFQYPISFGRCFEHSPCAYNKDTTLSSTSLQCSTIANVPIYFGGSIKIVHPLANILQPPPPTHTYHQNTPSVNIWGKKIPHTNTLPTLVLCHKKLWATRWNHCHQQHTSIQYLFCWLYF